MATNGIFECDCGGEIKATSETSVLHACKNKYAPGTSYYDGIARFISYDRVRVNPALTNGAEKYNWFLRWN